MNFPDLLTNVKNLNNNLDSIVIKAAMDNENFIADLNIEQLEQGKTNKGENIEPEYRSPEYSQLKKAMGSMAPAGVPNLKFSGDFYHEIYATTGGVGKFANTSNTISIDSHDEKTFELQKKYDSIFGLTDESISKLSEYIKPTLIERITDEITR